jgi:hypothetical protein
METRPICPEESKKKYKEKRKKGRRHEKHRRGKKMNVNRNSMLFGHP